jgi:DNA polymerase-3 subunit delta
VTGAGEVIDCSVRTAGERKGWLADRLHAAPVRFDAGAATLIRTHLGDDLGRLESLLGALTAAYGPGASIDTARLEPFLGEAGSVPPWELTGAIDDGDVPKALDALARMTGAGGMAGPAIIGMLQRHFSNMLRLSGEDVRNDDEAAELLGMRPGFPAKRTLAQSRRLGSERLGQAITLLADADVNVKGRTGLPASLVLEVLVARLTRLVRGGAPARAAARRR